MSNIQVGIFNLGEIPEPIPLYGEKFFYPDSFTSNAGEFRRYGIQTGSNGVFLYNVPISVPNTAKIYMDSDYNDDGTIIVGYSATKNSIVPESVIRINPTINNNGIVFLGLLKEVVSDSSFFNNQLIYLKSNTKFIIEMKNILTPFTTNSGIVIYEKG